jgi:hypothetical protein
MPDNAKSKLGRPLLPDHLRKHPVNVAACLPEDFARKVQAEAHRRGMSYSGLVRQFIALGMDALAEQEAA